MLFIWAELTSQTGLSGFKFPVVTSPSKEVSYNATDQNGCQNAVFFIPNNNNGCYQGSHWEGLGLGIGGGGSGMGQ